jgi:aminopeptidase N
LRYFFDIKKVKNPVFAKRHLKLSKAKQLLAAPSPKRSCYDVKYYKLDLIVDPDKKEIQGSVEIIAKAVTLMDTIQIDLNSRMKVHSLYLNNKIVESSRVEDAIFLNTNGIKSGELFNVKIEYGGKPKRAKRPPWKGGTVWKKDSKGINWCGVACETEGANLWWPNKDDVSDECDSMDFILTTKANLSVVSNGILVDSIKLTKDLITYKWHVSYPINNYNITYYLGDYHLVRDTLVSDESKSNILISYYLLSESNSQYQIQHLKQVKEQLAFYEKMFGPYPWIKDGFKLVESPFAGMEHQTAIAYGNGFTNEVDYSFDNIIIHETAHEWWGNSVTAADFSDIWLQEGFATYSEALFIEHTKGKQKYLEYLNRNKMLILNRKPIVKVAGKRDFNFKDADVYFKGALVLHSLRTTINNDSLFFDILKTFRIQNHGKQIFTDVFIELVNIKTKSDYKWFFKQYLYHRKVPIFEYAIVGDELCYRWRDVEEDFNKLPVQFEYGNTKHVIYPSNLVQKINLGQKAMNTLKIYDDLAYFGIKR